MRGADTFPEVMKTTNPLNWGQGRDERRGGSHTGATTEQNRQQTTNRTNKQGTGTWRDRLGKHGALTVWGRESRPEQKPGSGPPSSCLRCRQVRGTPPAHPQRVPKEGRRRRSLTGPPPRRLLTVDSVRPPTDTASPSSVW